MPFTQIWLTFYILLNLISLLLIFYVKGKDKLQSFKVPITCIFHSQYWQNSYIKHFAFGIKIWLIYNCFRSQSSLLVKDGINDELELPIIYLTIIYLLKSCTVFRLFANMLSFQYLLCFTWFSGFGVIWCHAKNNITRSQLLKLTWIH